MSTAKVDSSIQGLDRISAKGAVPAPPANAPTAMGASEKKKRGMWARLEAYISRLSTKNNFWHRVCSLIWLPYAFRSGISMKRLDAKRFRAVLPFKRVNRNWYNAMAGAALLGNCEVAAGLYLFSACGGDYIVVCKRMDYRFLRPCLGPAVYEVVACEGLDEKVATKKEFNIDMDIEIRQQLKTKGRDLRVGRCAVTFHCTPKADFQARKDRRREQLER